MSQKIIQRTKPVQVGVNDSVSFDGIGTDGFLPITSGTISITTLLGLVILPAFPVTAGNFVPLPFNFPDGAGRATFTTAGGASGVLCI